MPETYWDQLQKGPANDVPLITGNTKDESGVACGANKTVSQYISSLNSTYGSLAPQFFKAYPASDTTQASMNTNLLARDSSLVGSWSFVNYWSKSASSPFYSYYYWDHAPPGQNQGAHHMSEITYVFNNLYGTDLPWQSVDYEIAETISSYWANFVKTPNPHVGGSYGGNGTLAHWALSSSSGATTFHLSPPAPINANGLPVGYSQVPVAKDSHITLLNKFFETQTSL